MSESKREEQFRRLLGHVCAYCGILKSDRPPVWCVREHEVYAKRQAELLKSLDTPNEDFR